MTKINIIWKLMGYKLNKRNTHKRGRLVKSVNVRRKKEEESMAEGSEGAEENHSDNQDLFHCSCVSSECYSVPRALCGSSSPRGWR